jgi:hypothetical protein
MKKPSALRRPETPAEITEEAASRFAALAGRLQARGHDAHEVARFLNRILFCLFAEDVELLPEKLIHRLVTSALDSPPILIEQLRELFCKMAHKGGGLFGTERIQWFNGGLFADDAVLPLQRDDLELIADAAELDWAQVEPAILGTLFERGLDPAKRSQLGAHYTARTDIERIVEPVVMRPLRREFDALKARVKRQLDVNERRKEKAVGESVAARQLRLEMARKRGKSASAIQQASARVFRSFLERVRKVRVLDPACGSGNFLYVTLRLLKDFEWEVISWGAKELGITLETPQIGPEVVHGIELNAYASELARVSVWIGELQWMRANGFSYNDNPILKPLQTIECRDAILDMSNPEDPAPAPWPKADFIVGNPPFLGVRKMRTELGDDYVEALFRAWKGRVSGESDLVVYWHEKAREMIAEGRVQRAGLISTQGIRGSSNQGVLRRIKESGDIFHAYSDEPWVVEGASVRISIVCQDNGSEKERYLDGKQVDVIHADLAGGVAGRADLTTARRLQENLGVAFMGDTKGGKFDLSEELAREFLSAPKNVNGRSNADVIVPWVNGLDIARRNRGMCIIDFGVEMQEKDAARYELPFAHIRKHVLPKRLKNKRPAYRDRYWIHVEPRPALRAAITPLKRFIGTPRNGRQRTFVWLEPPTLPDCQVIVIARDDSYTFGVLQSRIHELWSLAMCSYLGVGNDPRYTPTTTFETFPFPWPLNTPEKRLTTKQREHRNAIAAAATELDELRENWLNPEDLVVQAPPIAPGHPPQLVAKNDEARALLAKRTLNNLYANKPQWLVDAHQSLDEAVLRAYGFATDVSDEKLLSDLLALNLSRPAADGAAPADEDGDSEE